ncbi:UDP-glucose 4-epimerase-like [Symsagittifera roscoffensis]
MAESGCNNIIFSSSCTVYGEPSREQLPITEQTPAGGCTCAYGRTKYFIEQMLSDYCRANESFNAVNLRYFNPVGAHESGTIGEDPTGVPNCLMPFVAQVATGRRAELGVFGNDYDTPDGTAIRDYVHVVDIAIGHVAALEKLIDNSLKKFLIYNLGTGKGHSVLEVVEAFRKASGAEIPYVIKPRREGDATEVYADCSLAKRDLGWEATRDLETMCRDFWTWQSKNPEGYRQTEKDVKDRRFISCPKL